MTPHEGHQISHHEHHHKSHHGGHQISNHGDHHKFHHEDKQKAPSKEISSPKQSSFNHGKKVEFSHGHESKFNSSTGHGSWKSDGLLGANEKQIMQLLNERLSSYLGKVRTLEQENAKFERNISDWYKNNPPKTPPDGTHYFRIIEDLQSQMSALAMDNSNIVLSMNNAKLAADDYRSKHEIELQLSNGTAMDMHNLSMVLQTLNGETGELETQVQSLEEEKQELKMNSEEEINYLLTQLGARVNVELNAAPSIDLNVALSEIRDEYENLMEKNLKEAEEMFLERSAELSREVASGSDQLQSIETELIEMKRCMQALEIELDSEITLNSALMGTLEEVETTFGSKLKGLQSVINNAESELAQIRSDLERQIHEYKKLMDQKTHLELEIATYKRLLDGHDIHVTGHHSTGEQHGSHQTAGYYAEGYAHYTKR
ncbi:keratin, type I cytoskeletal 19-like [Spea bombifrons]|uniref:keratin, type I cytoskeletal 19-like n=1 Tax=Spea bombifrons TaxID=233779 RepID=UPI00234BFE56|nr:keratin, type I cytoskeletal 19-like [Spea bombifrons]